MDQLSDGQPRTRHELRLLGLTDPRIDSMLRSGSLVRDHRGTFVGRGTDADLVRRARSAVKAVGHGATVARMTAARLYNFDGIAELAQFLELPGGAPVDLWVPRDATIRRRKEIHSLQTRLEADDVTSRFGVLITTPARTLVDLARLAPIGMTVGIVDAGLRDGHCTLAELRGALERVEGLRGVVGARRVISLSREGTRSMRETRIRLIIVVAGLPCPVVAHQIFDDHGRLLAEADLAYPALMIWIEYDGFDVHVQRETFRRDRPRQRLIERRGWHVLRAADGDVDDPHGFLDDLRVAIDDAPRRISALPDGLSPEADRAKAALLRKRS